MSKSVKINRSGKQPLQFKHEGGAFFRKNPKGNWVRLDPADPQHANAIRAAKSALGVTPRRKTKARGPSHPGRTHPPEPAIVVVNLGQALEITYRRAKDGKPYRHAFGNGVQLHRTRDGRQLIIGPVNAGDWIKG